MCGIYKIENSLNHHCYIGQSVDIYRRWNTHKRVYKNNDIQEYNTSLYRAFRKYNIENFSFEIIEECNVEELNEREMYWIKFYNSYHNGYNQTIGGEGRSCSGMYLTNDDVEEITQMLKTTNLSNQEISLHFNVSENMISAINTGRYWRRDGINYPIRNHTKQFNYCKECGKQISLESQYCRNCYSKNRRKINRPNKEELYKLLYDNYGSFTKVGKMFGVTDNTIRAWCNAYKIPSHTSAYYTKIKKTRTPLQKFKVKQIDKKGNIINTYDSINIAEKETGIYHIFEASDPNNKRKTAGGFTWIRVG